MPAVGVAFGVASRPAVAPPSFSSAASSRRVAVRASGAVGGGIAVASAGRFAPSSSPPSRAAFCGVARARVPAGAGMAPSGCGRGAGRRSPPPPRVTSGAHLAETSVSPSGYSRTATVGVLGGGQLGQMLGQEAVKLGVRLVALDPNPRCPASLDAEVQTGSFRDADAVWKLAEGVDVLTVEIEHVDAKALARVRDSGAADVQPSPEAIAVIQDKFAQKEHLARGGVAVADFARVSSAAEAQAAGRAFGFPLLLKARTLAYDGKGNAVVRAASDLDAAARALGGYGAGLYAERFVPFARELAVMVARGRDGSLTVFPPTQTRHERNVCVTTETPAAVPRAVRAAAEDLARRAVATLPGAGIFGVELFYARRGAGPSSSFSAKGGASEGGSSFSAKGGASEGGSAFSAKGGASEGGSAFSLLVNEIAPRPHNSGHYTIEACATSQFEAHLRAVLGWPAGDPSLKVGAAIMLNVLGRAEGDEGLRLAHETLGRALATPGATPHWYGKEGCSVGRKIGHVTIVGDSIAQVRERLRAIDPEAADNLERESPIESEDEETKGTGANDGAAASADANAAAHAAASAPGAAPSAAADAAASAPGTSSSTAAHAAASAPTSPSSAASAAAAPSASPPPRSSSPLPFPPRAPPVGIIMGSDSDLSAMRQAAEVLRDLGIESEVTIVSAHRTPDRMAAYARSARARGVKVIVAGAGGAAHLPGMVAAQTDLPVVGVPVVPNGARLDGLDALLSIVQMPKGVPVATVGIHNAANAGLLAARILGAADPEIGAKIADYMKRQENVVLEKARKLEGGWETYQA